MRSTDLDVTLLCRTISTLLMHPFSHSLDEQNCEYDINFQKELVIILNLA